MRSIIWLQSWALSVLCDATRRRCTIWTLSGRTNYSYMRVVRRTPNARDNVVPRCAQCHIPTEYFVQSHSRHCCGSRDVEHYMSAGNRRMVTIRSKREHAVLHGGPLFSEVHGPDIVFSAVDSILRGQQSRIMITWAKGLEKCQCTMMSITWRRSDRAAQRFEHHT